MERKEAVTTLKRQMLYASAPNECLQIFRDHLDEVERVLPIDSWLYMGIIRLT